MTDAKHLPDLAQAAPDTPLPCPFCGCDMQEVTDEDGHYWVHPGRKGIERADCWLCDAWISDELTGEGSIGEWNVRAAQPPAAPIETNADLPTYQDVRGILPRDAGDEVVNFNGRLVTWAEIEAAVAERKTACRSSAVTGDVK